MNDRCELLPGLEWSLSLFVYPFFSLHLAATLAALISRSLLVVRLPTPLPPLIPSLIHTFLDLSCGPFCLCCSVHLYFFRLAVFPCQSCLLLFLLLFPLFPRTHLLVADVVCSWKGLHLRFSWKNTSSEIMSSLVTYWRSRLKVFNTFTAQLLKTSFLFYST